MYDTPPRNMHPHGDFAIVLAMRALQGKMILIAGSAAPDAPPKKLGVAHDFVSFACNELLSIGGGIVVFAGEEPVNDAAVPLTFDWTVLRAVVAFEFDVPRRCVSVVTSKDLLERRISAENRELLARLCARDLAEMVFLRDAIRTGGNIADAQTSRASAMLAISGGKGIADRDWRLRDRGAPVLPMDLALGSLNGDGSGALDLYRELVEDPRRFFKHTHTSLRNKILGLSLSSAYVEPSLVARRAIEVIDLELAAASTAGGSDLRSNETTRRSYRREREDGKFVSHLVSDAIFKLHQAAVTCRLEREALLDGLHPEFRAQIHSRQAPSAQILSDLHALNAIETLPDGTVPLRSWLSNANALSSPRTEGSIFCECLFDLSDRGNESRG